MPMAWFPKAVGLVAVSLLTAPAYGHSFGKLYTLPVPFWLYGWASAAALLLSFLALAALSSQPKRDHPEVPSQAHYHAFSRPALCVLWGLRLIALSALVLTIVSGFFGTQDAYRNINMTLFWIVFVLGLAYATVIVGDIFSLINPWQTLLAGIRKARFAYPEKWSYWPAVVLYISFIWLELFAELTPWQLSAALLAYSLLNVLGVYSVGASAWFRYVEFFSVMLRLLGKLAPVSYCRAEQGAPAGWRLRWPGAGLMESRPSSMSEVVFILFMLSSTAFDGLHNTQSWALLYWQDVFAWLSPWLGHNLVTAYSTLKPLYAVYQSLALVLSPFIYWLIFAGCLGLMCLLTRRTESLEGALYRFSYSLLPIVVVYHFTHYFTLVLGQGPQIFSLLSDPLGVGWNVLGLVATQTSGVLLDMSWVWHLQVGLILLGHIASVFVAHEVAKRLYATSQQVWISQVPLLVLMMAFTVFGLWILAQPLDTEVLR